LSATPELESTDSIIPPEPPAAPVEPPAAQPMPVPDSLAKIKWPAAGAVFALPAGHGSSDAFQLAGLASRQDRHGTLTIFCASAADGGRLAEEIPFFAPQLSVAIMPDWETLPYDTLSPHQDLISDRLAALYELNRGKLDVLICSVNTALHRLAPPSFLASYTFYFDKGSTVA